MRSIDKVLTAALGLFVITFVGILVAGSRMGGARPQVVYCEPSELVLGRLPANTTKGFSFKVCNATKTTVRLTDITKSCGCTEAAADKTTLAPGEVATVSGSLTTDSEPTNIQVAISVTYAIEGGKSSVTGALITGASVPAQAEEPNRNSKSLHQTEAVKPSNQPNVGPRANKTPTPLPPRYSQPD